jgi:hypothetical protein
VKHFYILLLIVVACTEKQGRKKEYAKDSESPENSLKDTIYFNADTIKNRPVGKGFYQNDAGDIFELKRSGFGEDYAGAWSAFIFLDDELKDSSWDNPGKLREYIDVETYTEDSMGAYSKDKKHVYWIRSTSDGPVRLVLHGIDAKTFVVSKTNPDSAWDYRYFYYEGVKVGKVNSQK